MFGAKRRPWVGNSRHTSPGQNKGDSGSDVVSDVAEDRPDPLLMIASEFHSTARAEIIQRIGNRDTALFIFLAGSATLFSISFRPTLHAALFAIPILGLGTSQVYSQHSTVIGAIGRYLGCELHAWLARNYPDREVPPQWDNSESLLEMRGEGFLRPVMVSGIALIVFPEILSLIIAGLGGPSNVFNIAGLSVGVVATMLTLSIILSAYRARKEYAKELRSFSVNHGSSADSSA